MCDTLRIKTVRGLSLYDIRMSVVPERVHTSAKFPNTPRDKKKTNKRKAKQCKKKFVFSEISK